LSPFRAARCQTRRLDIPDAGCKGEKDSGYVGRSAADGRQCCPFIPGGDLGMSRLEGSFSQLTRRKSVRRVGYRPALSRLGDLAACGARPSHMVPGARTRCNAAALEPSQRHMKRADSGGSDESHPVDHDDLLALLERPRPRHRDLRALLRRTSSIGQAEKTRKLADIANPTGE
jgi:hypothetical protein